MTLSAFAGDPMTASPRPSKAAQLYDFGRIHEPFGYTPSFAGSEGF